MAKARKKPLVATIIVAVLIVIGIALDVVAFGVLADVLTMRFGRANAVDMTEAEKTQIKEDAKAVAREIAGEGFVLLDNNGTLPVASGAAKLDLLGFHSRHVSYGGTGSGAPSDKSTPVDFKTAFESAGFTVNRSLYDSYAGNMSMSFDWQEPDPATYWDKTDPDADLAVIVFARAGGEGGDLPTTGFGADGKSHYLELSENEKSLLRMAAAHYENIVTVINSGNMIELGDIKALYSDEKGTKGNIDAVIFVGKPGYHGLTALADIVRGEINPSGKITDTYVYDAFDNPAAALYGDSKYTNLKVKDAGSNDDAHYQEYSEGIYVGYRYYETAATLGHINYDEKVIYPFGRGLSYTDFEWEILSQSVPSPLKGDSKISVTVRVTNRGEIAGKDTVQLYSVFDKPALEAGRLDKSAASLVAFAKTKLIEPNDSDTVTLEFSAEDLASYDDRGVYASGGAFVAEEGEYDLVLRTDSHTDKGDLRVTAEAPLPIVYAEAAVVEADTSVTKRPTDLASVSNAFGSFDKSTLNGGKYGMDIEYLTVGSAAELWTGGLVKRGDIAAPSELVAFIADGANVSVSNKGYPVRSDVVEVGVAGDLDIKNFAQTPYEDKSWDALVSQMKAYEQKKLIIYGGYKTDAVDSVNKLKSVDADGPSGLNYFPDPKQYWGIAYPCPVVIASTWNIELAEKFGAAVAAECRAYGVGGWYAPGANIHRNAFGGRNFEYYGEDPVLSGMMAMGTCSAVVENGVVPYLKHFVLNDTEINRNNNVLHWATEQSLREIYLKPFEYAVKADVKFGKTATTGMMSGFNYIGDRWCGASYELLTGILRGEWGFKGTVVTDYFGGYGCMNADCAIRAGNDLMLNTIVVSSINNTSADDKYYIHQACKNILYSYSRCALNGADVVGGGMEPWQVFALIANIVWWAATVALGVLAALGWIKYAKRGKDKADDEAAAE